MVIIYGKKKGRVEMWLQRRHVLLIAPRVGLGLQPKHLAAIQAFLAQIKDNSEQGYNNFPKDGLLADIYRG